MSLDAGAPFTVGNSRTRALRQLVVGVALVVVGVALVRPTDGAAIPLVAVGAGLAVVLISLLTLRHRAPVLRADRAGVAMQAFKGPEGVRTLRWEQVEAVYVHRIGRQFRMLCILPNDLDAERAWAGEGRAGVIDGSLKRVGAPYSVNLVPAGLRDDEALARLSALGAPLRN